MRTIERDAAPMGGRGKGRLGRLRHAGAGGCKKDVANPTRTAPKKSLQIVAINLEAELGSMNLAQSLGLQRFSP
jgi:hypothetical protein